MGAVNESRPVRMQAWMTLAIIFILSTLVVSTYGLQGSLGQKCRLFGKCDNPLAICLNDTCTCNDTFTTDMKELKCKASLNSYCTVYDIGGGCTVPNAICKAIGYTKRCLCKMNHIYDNITMECIEKGEGLMLKTSGMVLILGIVLSTILQ